MHENSDLHLFLFEAFAVGLVLLFAASGAHAAGKRVISWSGNTPQWNKQLGVNELRMGCWWPPQQCLQTLDNAIRQQGGESAVLAISPDPDRLVKEVAEYSAASLTEPRLRGIGIDDFLGAVGHWRNTFGMPRDVGQLMRQILADTASRNSSLQFGITLYENELSSPLLMDSVLPAEVRAGIGRVSLYLHFRENGDRYADYVRQVKELFPRAEIIAGVYAYDRSDYIPCAEHGTARCSPEREMELFLRALRTQVALLKSGEVSGLEFYPGNFGTEQDWKGWSNAKICQQEHRQQCIERTQKMHQEVLLAIK